MLKVSHRNILACCVATSLIFACNTSQATATTDKIIHDAEFYIIKAQNGEKWAADDKILDEKLAAISTLVCSGAHK